MKRLERKVAVIPGVNSDIGLAAAKRLQEEGAKIAIFGRSRRTLDEAVKTIEKGVVAVQGDVAKLTDVTSSTPRSRRSWEKLMYYS
jgi:NADP-dependent 3-hydroxy acid dehydrogenase YdfG